MLNSTITGYLNHHETRLRELLIQADIPAERIKNAMLYSLFPGGKRLRPLLVYLTGQIAEVSLPILDLIAAAIELTHCYSLIHDDLPAMDNDDYRRGKPSCHKAFDEATAILAGDGMQALAVTLLLQQLPALLSPLQVIAVTSELTLASGPAGMVSGQSLDLSELTGDAVSEEKLHIIHKLKTGQLILACINMVLAASQANRQTIKALQTFANHLGLVFQMQDDYLDHYGDIDLLGKRRSSDVANNKFTFAQLYKQAELYQLIEHHFQLARSALLDLGEQASDLLALTDVLYRRSHQISQNDTHRV